MANGAFNKRVQRRRGFKLDGDLLSAIVEMIPRGATVADWGCGNGPYVIGMRSFGLRAYGLDGSHSVPGLIEQLDFTEPIRMPIVQAAVTIETGEHIPKESEEMFAENITRNTSRLLIASWAKKNQRGRNHINCKEPWEVVDLFQKFGWSLDLASTIEARILSGTSGFDRKLLVMRRGGRLTKIGPSALRFLQDSLTAKQTGNYLRRSRRHLRRGLLTPEG